MNKLFVSDDKQGFTRFSKIISLPCRLFDTIRLKSIPDAQFVVKNPLLLDFLPIKKHAVLSFHAKPFHDTIIVEKHPEDKQYNGNPEKKIFRVGTDIVPDFPDNLFHAYNALVNPVQPESKGRRKAKRTRYLNGFPAIFLYPECLFSWVASLIAKLLFDTEQFIILCHTVGTRQTTRFNLAGIGCHSNLGNRTVLGFTAAVADN
jgi:hypothetical protein